MRYSSCGRGSDEVANGEGRTYGGHAESVALLGLDLCLDDGLADEPLLAADAERGRGRGKGWEDVEGE